MAHAAGADGLDRDVARRHLRFVAAAPRPAGSPAERDARQYAAGVLRAAGYEVREEPFEYSALPGRYATPLAGVLSVVGLALAARLGRHGHPALALATLGVVIAAAGVGGRWLARRGVLEAPWLRRRGVNLVATRSGEPRLWLVAHVDSKSQPVPILARAAGIAVTALAWAGALGVALAQLAEPAAARLWPAVVAGGVVAAVPVVASVVGARSAGAVDNASGVASALLAAAAAPAATALGVLLTSAEELGLAGARAWVRARPPGVAINFDGVDDDGALTCMVSGRAPAALIAAVRRAARALGTAVRVRRLLPGVLVDGVALADAGWEVVTVSKGTPRTLARIHTAADTLARLDGRGVAAAARLAVSTIREYEAGRV